MNPRVRALHDLDMAGARENAGLHEYDGVVQDLSPENVSASLARVGDGPPEPDGHDEAHLSAVEAGCRTTYGMIELHRWNPLVHLGNLDLACYDREYAPSEQRAEARRRHLDGWPGAIESSLEALDRVPAPVAEALLPATRGLAAGLGEDADAALAAHGRLVAHLELAAGHGPPEASIGGAALARLMGDGEAMTVDLSRLAMRAEAELARLTEMLKEQCASMDASRPVSEIVASLTADHPRPDGVAEAALSLIDEVNEFTYGRDLLGPLGGECLVGPAPESRRWAMAMMSWAAPYEEDAPSWFYVTPPDPSWPAEEQEEWMAVFSRTTLPAITVHEVTPGHFAHGRMLRRANGDVRKGLLSMVFAEGWAHYVEELMFEEGFQAPDPRYGIGMCIEALVRVTRLRSSIGLHTGSMTLDDATRAFEADAFLKGPAALSEARRATYDPGYGCYTWGKLVIRDLRDEAMAVWGPRYSHRRFNEALLAFGSPPLGLIGDIFD